MASRGMRVVTPTSTTAVNQVMHGKLQQMPNKDPKTLIGIFIWIQVLRCLNNKDVSD